MDEPWMIYYEELHERGEEIPDSEGGGVEEMAEVAHEAHEATVDRLVNQLDWDEEDALEITRNFGRTLEQWIEEKVSDWDDLRDRLEEDQQEWEILKEGP